jgi:hypothetical protein
MISEKIQENETYTQSSVESGILSDNVLSIGGNIFSVLGKTIVTVGLTGLLMYVFFQLEMLIGLGAVYTGAIAVAGGLVSMVIGNKLSTGNFFDGLLNA